MKRPNAKFLVSAEKLSQCPEYNLPEFALLGRSNVGKSSFINALADNKKLAKTSNVPGKTRLINFFDFENKFIIADLPGYGYAKISKELQAKWQKHLEEYLLKRESIKSLIQFIDARHEIQKNDYQMREWISAFNLPVFTLVTKSDYVPKNKRLGIMNYVKKEFGGDVFLFSTQDKSTSESVLNFLYELSVGDN